MSNSSHQPVPPQKQPLLGALATLITALAAVIMLVVACAPTSSSSADSLHKQPEVITTIYPLHYVAVQVAGENARATSLLPAGGDAHHAEVSLRQVRQLQNADILLFLSEFQPAVDQAAKSNPPASSIDVAQLIELRGYAENFDPAEPDQSAHHDEHDHGVTDPHFWLEPSNLAVIATALAEELGERDPQNSENYLARAEALSTRLLELEGRYETELSRCESSTLVVSHAAFGYLTEPLGLTQIGIAGLDPDSEPSLARIRQIRDTVASQDVTTIFYESPTNPYVAQKVADSLGLQTALLDPLEIQNDPQKDYLDVMNENLQALRTALECA